MDPAVNPNRSTHSCRGEHGVGLCNPYAKIKRETCCPSRRANQPDVQLCVIYPSFHPGNIQAVSSISFYAADVKTWLPINSLQLSSHKHSLLHSLNFISQPASSLPLPFSSYPKTQKLECLDFF